MEKIFLLPRQEKMAEKNENLKMWKSPVSEFSQKKS